MNTRSKSLKRTSQQVNEQNNNISETDQQPKPKKQRVNKNASTEEVDYRRRPRVFIKKYINNINSKDILGKLIDLYLIPYTRPLLPPIGTWNVSNITDMSRLFYAERSNTVSGRLITDLQLYSGYNSFNEDISSWDVSNVTNMEAMFSSTIFFNQPLNNWNVSNVTNMNRMFLNCNRFNQPLNNWNVSNVTDMECMFQYAKSFNQPLNNWDVSNVTIMRKMFKGAKSFNQPLNDWNVSNVTSMASMFESAENFNQPLNNWNVSNVTNMNAMFYDALDFNQPINDWDVSKVTNMAVMFKSAESFNQPLNNWNVSNVTDMEGMFMGAESFNQPLNNWDVSNVEDFNYIFLRALEFNQDLSSWNISKQVFEEKTDRAFELTKMLLTPERQFSPDNRRRYVEKMNSMRAAAITIPKIMNKNYNIQEPAITHNVLSYLTDDDQTALNFATRGQNLVSNMDQNRMAARKGGKKYNTKKRLYNKRQSRKSRKSRK